MTRSNRDGAIIFGFIAAAVAFFAWAGSSPEGRCSLAAYQGPAAYERACAGLSVEQRR